MKYTVKVNYTKFEFDNGTDALAFAEIAKESAAEKITVEIALEVLEREGEENE